MATWRLAKSLIKLREQLDTTRPNRSKASDGSIGDTAHSARKSDHNPNAQGVVTAIDITHDPANDVDGYVLSRQLAKDRRTKYVIFNAEIYRSYKPQLGWAKYTGANAHRAHVHVSVLAASADDTLPWFNGLTPATLRYKDTGAAVMELQHKLGIKDDGIFGRDTENAVREFQAHHGLDVDGVVGSRTWAVLDKE